MKTKISKEKTSQQAEILLTIPEEILEDLRKIALFNNSGFEDLIYSYIVNGVVSDLQIVKRMESTDNVNKILRQKDFHLKTAEEIISGFKLVY